MTIVDWHARLLDAALAWRVGHPDFRFNLRTADVPGTERLNAGYWFTGNDDYLFFAPFRPHEPLNKTRTVGFVVGFAADGGPKSCSLSIVFGGTTDSKQRALYQQMLTALGPFTQEGKDKYRRKYSTTDPTVAFNEFLATDLPKLREMIHAAGMDEVFLVSDAEFKAMLERVEGIRSGAKKVSDEIPASASAGAERRLSLLGTWRNVQKADVERVRAAIASKGGWASWWSFPVRDAFRDQLKSFFYIYLNDGNSHIPYRMRVKKFQSSPGNDGMVSPWPEITDAEFINKTRNGQKNSEIYKTWLYVTGFDELESPLSLEDFEPAEGVKRSAMLLPSAFGYGYLKSETPAGNAKAVGTPVNLILYGPPGTGKTHWLREKFKEYTDTPSNVDRDTWLKDEIRRYKVVTFHPSFTYEDFVRGIRPVATSEDGTTQFRLVDGKFKQICDEAHANQGNRYALFIDEINRANIAKVFGELITLIEPAKRAVFDADGRLVSGMAVQLPGGDNTEIAERPFGVPKNLDIYGTMNTADRSIALLDVALRRRFQFEEREPDYSTLDRSVDSVHLGKLLQRVNDRLEYLLDRDHRIGHGYLMQVKTLEDLRGAFAMQFIPLLQEYFFDDFSRVAMVLSTVGTARFVTHEQLDFTRLFAGQRLDGVPTDRTRYTVTPTSSWAAESFRGIYTGEEADALSTQTA